MYAFYKNPVRSLVHYYDKLRSLEIQYPSNIADNWVTEAHHVVIDINIIEQLQNKINSQTKEKKVFKQDYLHLILS